MKPEEFLKQLKRKSREFNRLILVDLPEIIGTEAQNHFREGFERSNQGFTDTVLSKWDPRKEKRRKDGSMSAKERTRTSRPVLTGETGKLAQSVQFETQPGRVIVFSDMSYAKAHNEGTSTAGRNHTVVIPQRKFIGESRVLNEKIESIIREELNKLFQL